MKKLYVWLGALLTVFVFISCIWLENVSNILARRGFTPLDGVTIVLDAGHGGKDGGANQGNIEEDEINLAITKKLKGFLQDSGATIVMTREEDVDLASEDAENRKKEDMQARVAYMNDAQTDAFISIHLNAFPNTTVHGSQVFYKKEDVQAKVFAQMIHEHMQQITNTNMTIKEGDYYILNEATTLGVLIECGFLSNIEDRNHLVDEQYQKDLAKSIYLGILQYFSFLDA